MGRVVIDETKTGHMLITVEVECWALKGSLFYSLYFCIYLNLSITQS